jgi:hypothetical protein
LLLPGNYEGKTMIILIFRADERSSQHRGVTFDRVNRMVVLWDSEECRVGPGDIGEVPEDLDEWLDATPLLNDIPCP